MARKIDTDAEIDLVRVKDQVGDPANPAAGYKYLYVKSGGLYLINSAGVVVGPFSAGGSVATDAIWDAAGDLVQGTGPNAAAKLTIGTAYQIPRVNAGATALEYVSAGRVLIAESTPTGTGTVTWDSISNRYSSLQIEIVGRTDKAATASGMNLFFNNDTTATNYCRVSTTGSGTTIGTGTAANADCLALAAGSATASYPGICSVFIPYYKSTTFMKLAQVRVSYRLADDTTSLYMNLQDLFWENTAAISRIDIVVDDSSNYVAGSTFRLYGVF